MTLSSETRHAVDDTLYQSLIEHDGGRPDAQALARIITSWYHGDSVLPAWLGLKSAAEFQQLRVCYFPTMVWAEDPLDRPPLSSDLHAERDDLANLLLKHRAGHDNAESWLAMIVAAGCLGSDHLWRDLGLWSRDDLTAMLTTHFPGLVEKNSHNMKWKKFLYKQLCLMEGSYTCRAPSCEVCIDYEKCFGSEE